jgi:CDP-diacylglycerol--serine O-phosphatidyltransferase
VFAVLPTLLTLGNAACGFGAITYAARVGPDPPAGDQFLFISAVLIFLAMLFDMLDGSVARLARQTSDFGAQLDSLCDAVSFGVAPAFLMLRLLHWMEPNSDPGHLEQQFQPFFEYPSRLLWVIACLFGLCALLRLARFNVETDEEDSHTFFSGLPSPAAAATIASFPIALMGLRSRAIEEGAWQSLAKFLIPATYLLLPAITLSVAMLMVSRFRYAHFFNQLFHRHRSRLRLIQIILTLAIVFVLREAMPLIFCYFAFTPPVQSAWRELTRRGFRRLPPVVEPPRSESGADIEESTRL